MKLCETRAPAVCKGMRGKTLSRQAQLALLVKST